MFYIDIIKDIFGEWKWYDYIRWTILYFVISFIAVPFSFSIGILLMVRSLFFGGKEDIIEGLFISSLFFLYCVPAVLVYYILLFFNLIEPITF